MTNNQEVISHANPHTIKKFELIEKYVHAWAHKLLNIHLCDGIVFIDCMSNSGEYFDDNGNQIFGTPVRVAKYLRTIAGQYPNKNIELYFSDLCEKKTEHLKKLMPNESSNFHYFITSEDGNDLAKRLGNSMSKNKHYLLVYDPYDATINWQAIMPFIKNWSEVIINHMVSDSMRAIKVVKKDSTKSKYENTYLMTIKQLLPFGSDKKAYEKRIEEIIKTLRKNKHNGYYIAAFPFFNEKNALVYNLIHCTNNINGFKLFKTSAWKAFGGKSSTKNTHGTENEFIFDFEGTGITPYSDESCFYIKDIATYIQKTFNGKKDVPLNTVWEILESHPIFPSDGFRTEIKNELKQYYRATVTRSSISFIDRN